MILEYHRPATIDEALALLTRTNPRTVPLGGGTTLSQKGGDPVAVVDLQTLGLDFIRIEGTVIEAGAMVRMRGLAAHPQIQPALSQAITKEYSSNLREMTTLGGALVSNDGRSAFLTALLALDTKLIWLPGASEHSLGDYLPVRRSWDGGLLIHSVKIPGNVKLSLDSVARTPGDRPILIGAVCRWPSGRTRVALGGYGSAPLLVLDGPDARGAEMAARNAYLHAGDEWASAEYRSQVAVDLIRELCETSES
jgi:CO/xanthine dehydrogenase FAD-binding subunit